MAKETMMRVAVAGTNSLALLIAHFIVKETSHQVLVLSRFPQPTLENQGYQVIVVDYTDQTSLQHAVMGVDTVISTVTGVPGMELLKASVQQGVRRFAPAEFEGLPSRRPHNDPLDRDNSKASIRLWLDHYRTQRQIESTIFTCGVLYERFGPGGLRAHRLGLNSHLDGEGDFIINVRHMTATAPVYDASNQPNVTVCLTAAEDVARFVVKALDLSRWPEEMTMVGERLTVLELLRSVERARRTALTFHTYEYPASLQSELALAEALGDVARAQRARDHIATALGRYNFNAPGTLNRARGRRIIPVSFEDWLRRVWSNVPPPTSSTYTTG